MSPASRRRKRRPQTSQPATPQTTETHPPLPEWHWRTFPVFFALAAGLFFGLQLGVIVTSANSTVSIVVFVLVAVVLGLALSRLTTHWLLQRNWIKPRPKRR